MSNYTLEKADHKEWVEANLKPKVGSVIQPDGWGLPSTLVDEDWWDKAEFRLPSPTYFDVSSAVNVELSERSKKIYVTGSAYKLRVKITFVGDCEPDIVVHGWLWV